VAQNYSSAVFVYGTLKTGQINHVLLLPYIASVEAAEVDGALYDVGDFPALVVGAGQVQGEVVTVHSAKLADLLSVLDELENYHPDDPASSMYIRRIVAARVRSGRVVSAHAYFYNPEHPALPPLTALRRLDGGAWAGESVDSPPEVGDGLQRYREYVRTFSRER
jgi:gamma-glutamylcyclotransferase (GGCT)/AIG2-like uncharacterized protein YtfP